MMNLYSGTTCPFSHRCRIVLFEKGMDFQVIDVDLFNKPEEMAAINPHNRVPVLVEREPNSGVSVPARVRPACRLTGRRASASAWAAL